MSARSASTGRSFSPPLKCAASPPPPDGRDGADSDISMPSPPPSPRPLGHPSRRPAKEICVVPRSSEIDAAEARLSTCALLGIIVGTRPSVHPVQLGRYLEEFHALLPEDYSVSRYHPEDFLVEFASPAAADRVLHSHPNQEATFQVKWKRWRRQHSASLASLRYKVLIQLKNIPTHARNISTAQTVLGSACSGLTEAPPEVAGDHRRCFYVAAWCIHPDLVPVEKLVFIPEPPEQFEGGNLFLKSHEIIHSKHDGLWYRVFAKVIQIQDWADESSSESSEDDNYPGFRQRHRHQPWPKVHSPGGEDEAGFDGGAGLSLGPGWGPSFTSARGGAIGAGVDEGTTWSLRAPLRFGSLERPPAFGTAQPAARKNEPAAVEQPLAHRSDPPRSPSPGDGEDMRWGRLDDLGATGRRVQVDPMWDEAGRCGTRIFPGPPRQQLQDKQRGWDEGNILPLRSHSVSALGKPDPMLNEACWDAGGKNGLLISGYRFGPPLAEVDDDQPTTLGSDDFQPDDAVAGAVGLQAHDADGPPDGGEFAGAQHVDDLVGVHVSTTTPVAQPPMQSHQEEVLPVDLEVVRFHDIPLLGISNSPTQHAFVTTTRGSHLDLPLHIPEEACTPVKTNVARFASGVCRPKTPTVLNRTPPRRKTRTQLQLSPNVPRHSERLAKKSLHRPTKPALQAQNVLMKRLGISSAAGPPDAAAFQRFLEVFTGTVTASQCEAMDAILPSGGPSILAAWSEVEP
ncbi:unnamed protein product [Urochloa decumbens]|uniref:Uncharacterized protein n=1 Tax=Urochloa decumbens TaxID=240449 RepID=A0ABC9B4J3_9POAL